jgi:hypothetical protein
MASDMALKGTYMNELTLVEKLAEWQRLKALVLDSVSSSITRRVGAQISGRDHSCEEREIYGHPRRELALAATSSSSAQRTGYCDGKGAAGSRDPGRPPRLAAAKMICLWRVARLRCKSI